MVSFTSHLSKNILATPPQKIGGGRHYCLFCGRLLNVCPHGCYFVLSNDIASSVDCLCTLVCTKIMENYQTYQVVVTFEPSTADLFSSQPKKFKFMWSHI